MPERYAAVPKITLTEQSFVGIWEQINMQYQYQVIQRAAQLILSANKQVGGSGSGTWSYDESKRILTINNMKYHIEESWDWEAAPRKQTLTFSGLTSSGRPVWGKKIG